MDNFEILETAKFAANWWAEKIQQLKFDNGDRSREGYIASYLATMIAADDLKKVKPQNIGKFKELLAKYTSEEILRYEYGSCELYVDYEPVGILYQAASEAKISSAVFPWKTYMYVERDRVEANGKIVYPSMQKVKK